MQQEVQRVLQDEISGDLAVKLVFSQSGKDQVSVDLQNNSE